MFQRPQDGLDRFRLKFVKTDRFSATVAGRELEDARDRIQVPIVGFPISVWFPWLIHPRPILVSYLFTIPNDAESSRIQWYKKNNDSWIEQITLENQTEISYSITSFGDQWYCNITPFNSKKPPKATDIMTNPSNARGRRFGNFILTQLQQAK